MDPPRAGVANGEEARQGPSTLLQKACESCPFFLFLFYASQEHTDMACRAETDSGTSRGISDEAPTY